MPINVAKESMNQTDSLEKEQHLAPVQKPGSRTFGAEPECDVVAGITGRDGIPPHWVSVVIARAIRASNDINRLLS